MIVFANIIELKGHLEKSFFSMLDLTWLNPTKPRTSIGDLLTKFGPLPK